MGLYDDAMRNAKDVRRAASAQRRADEEEKGRAGHLRKTRSPYSYNLDADARALIAEFVRALHRHNVMPLPCLVLQGKRSYKAIRGIGIQRTANTGFKGWRIYRPGTYSHLDVVVRDDMNISPGRGLLDRGSGPQPTSGETRYRMQGYRRALLIGDPGDSLFVVSADNHFHKWSDSRDRPHTESLRSVLLSGLTEYLSSS